MGLLDELRRKAEAAREARGEPAREDAARTNQILAVALPAMFRIHHALSEFVAQLKELDEETPATLKIPGIGEVGGFVQRDYEVLATGTPPDVVTLRCALRQTRPKPLELRTPGSSITGWMDGMRRQGLQVKVLRMVEATGPNQRAHIAIEGHVAVTLQFMIDLDTAGLQLYTRNFDELADRRQFFNPASVTEAWCDELLKFILRRENRFLVHEVPPDVREQLRRRIEWERRKAESQEETTENRMATTSRLRNLLFGRAQLKLRYRDQSWTISAQTGPFVLGRVADCDLQIREQRVSRFHARIEPQDDEYLLIDDSTNGTHVRFEDGRAVFLKQSSTVLNGSGLIALGTEATEINPHVVHFAI